MAQARERLVRVVVYDFTDKLLEEARITLGSRDPAEKGAYELRFDPHQGGHVGRGIRPGGYRLRAEAEGYAPEERDVQVDPAGLDTIVILGSPGLPFLYRGEVKVPFRSYRDLVAVSLKPGAAPAGTEQVIAVARRMKLELVEVGEQVRRQNVLAFRLQGEAAEGEVARVVEELQRVEGVAAAGSVVRMDRESLSFLTDELVVKFKSHVDLDAVPEIARRFELSTLRGLPQAGNAFLFRSSGPATYALLEVAARLVESGTVEYAEPNLVSTVVDDAINPTDFLSPMQWHLPLINCPDAWQVISDNFGAGFTFGSPNLNIAVVDSGVDVGNLDFSGAVSNGSPKVYQIFDFQNMVGNNNSRQGGHGTCCAGIATALPNNPSGVAGQNEGAVGSGGNCRLMAIERPFPGSEVAYSDMYVWVGGFNPNSGTAGFPAQISPGADVITNSFGYSVGMPISGLMKDTFDLLTTYGRGGRGVLLFFSAGNNSVDFTLQRPWAAYTRTFAIAASSLDTDGVTEIRAPYSNFGGSGIIDVCAPSDSALGAIYDPPRSYGTVTPTDRTSSDFPPDAPGHWTVQTTMSAAATGVTSLTVASSAGFAGNQFIIIGPPGTAGAEFGMVTGVPDATHLSVQALKNAHGAGTAVFGGPANILTNFGGTSSATPLAAGVGALLLTVRPSLTWVQVRDLLRGTAVHIDAANTNLVGIWRDQNGVASNQPGYLGAVYSRWYGFGRIDAVAAVNGALGLGATADVIVRENLGDSGLVPSVGTFWNSPDIWVRNLSPAAEGAAALPPNYTTAGPTQDAQASHDNYVYVRVKNIGPVPTSTFYVRVYLSHWAGTEFVYPTDFIPTTRPSDPLPSPLVPGTYLLGEVQHGPLGPNGVDSVNVTWVQAAIPPETVIVNGTTVHWHPCLLVEISPQDGPTPAGVHVWDNNNLGQKNVTIDYASDDATFGAALVVGNLLNRSGSLELYVDRSQVPAGIHLYIDVLDPRVKKELKRLIQEDGGPEGSLPPEVVLLDETRVLVERSGSERCQEGLVVTLPRHARLKLCDPQEHPGRPSRISVGYVRGREVFLLPPDEIIRIPLRAGPGGLIPMIVGGVVTERVEDGGYPVGITQRDANGTTSGAAAVEVRVGKDREG